MDSLSKEARSELMGRVKSSGTKPEARLVAALARAGAKPSRTAEGIPGSPDAAYKRAKVAVFVDGCFWHACPLHARKPSGDSAPYWLGKLAANAERDRAVGEELRAMGWLVIRIWEHDLASDAAASAQAARVAEAVQARLDQ